MTTDPRTEAHAELRRRGITDDVPDGCIVVILFVIGPLAALFAASIAAIL